MIRTILASLLILGFAGVCLAQNTPAWELFAGYSFQRADVREYYKSTPIVYTFRHQYVNMNGAELSVTENMNRWFGGTLDFSAHFASPQVLGVSNKEHSYSIFYGPQVAYRKSFGTAFARVLVGGTHTGVSVDPSGPHASDFTLSFAAGGGLDLNLTNKAAVRILQADYVRTSALGISQNNYRLSAGMLFRLGKPK
jgi:hypothetical protein